MLNLKASGFGVTEEMDAPPADCHRKIRQAFAYWQKIHPPVGLPGRQHFEPTDVPGLLRHLRIIEIAGAPPAMVLPRAVQHGGTHTPAARATASPSTW